MTEDFLLKEVSDNNKNINNIKCQFCNSIILKSLAAFYIKNEFKLPLMHQKNKTNMDGIEAEVLKHFWVVDDMFTFENIGFSKSVSNAKFLICADCEMGPVGYHDLGTEKCYIALSRVKHVN